MEFRWLWNIGRIAVVIGGILIAFNGALMIAGFINPTSEFAGNYFVYRDFLIYGLVALVVGGVLQVLVRMAQKSPVA
jgi:hypothetical protein